MRYWSALVLIFIVRGSFADQNYVPTGSMEPTIHVGDMIYVNKMAYDLRLPFTDYVLKQTGEPQRGDIIVFFHPVTGKRLVKRVVGVPGDELEVVNGFITINGRPVEGTEDGVRLMRRRGPDEYYYHEKLGAHNATIKRIKSYFRPDTCGVRIPMGEYFAMGDNRDNSDDSRGWGLVPRANIRGRAQGVIWNMAFDPLPNPDLTRVAMALE